MPNPGSFPGARGEFLKAQLDLYAEAVRDGHIADTIADIQRRYFLRWPVTLPHDQEQLQERLDNVDDSAIGDDLDAPNVDGMSPEEASRALADHDKLLKEFKLRKEVCFLSVQSHLPSSSHFFPYSQSSVGCSTCIQSLIPTTRLEERRSMTSSIP